MRDVIGISVALTLTLSPSVARSLTPICSLVSRFEPLQGSGASSRELAWVRLGLGRVAALPVDLLGRDDEDGRVLEVSTDPGD